MNSTVLIPTRTSSIDISNTFSVYAIQVNEILITENLKLIMLLTIQMKNEDEPDKVPINLVNLLGTKYR